MKTLIINSYAGSLTLGASALGLEIVGSYEDANFGLDVQKANFPWLNFIEERRHWPKQDFSEVFVIAHPPCSAFSVQNTVKTTKGTDSVAFDCTKQVLNYAMDNRALGVAIESVMGALPGAWHLHQRYADERGYHLYRVLQNGCMFGCQWRERFWAIWLRKGVADPVMPMALTPRFQTVQEVVDGWEDGPTCGNCDTLLERQKKRLVEEARCTPEEMAALFERDHSPTTPLGRALWKLKFPEDEQRWVFEDYISGFSSGQLIFLDPDGLAPTLMGGSFWYLNRRCISEDAMKRIGGFPGTYIFPTKPRDYAGQMRVYISKGVIPAVAEWVLQQVAEHLGWRWKTRIHGPNAYRLEARPNLITDFRIRRRHHPSDLEHGMERPQLRHFDD